ncbi:cysteine hydrolase [Agromyces intestinalis]|uniref:Cysteine hydrolase n=1 Tax=Agromyces intestinalis TaxID=2592652 RepID=A0A5C1YJE7_9MICO|nr:isochorismatase family cysteine hydrolase [Agromyces intestinalis]QEO14932.1 cysteine hydrolase [Agromyces intestinalis]
MSALRERQLGGLTADGAALLVVDVQRSFGDPEFLAPYELDDAAGRSVAAAVDASARLVDTARAAGVPVFWVELGTDPGSPWRASAWLRAGDLDAPLSADEPCVIGTPGAEWYRLRPSEGEARIVKRGYSGFLGTDLGARLEASGVRWVTVAGLTTECCVAATATDAIQLGWPVVVATDATAAYDVDLHAHALEQLALNVGVLATVDEVRERWEAVR